MNFLEWNDAITSHFFRPEASGRTVYLYVTEDVIEDIGGPGSLSAFIGVMRDGPGWATRQGVCQQALQCLDGWRERQLTYPPYVGYLALFVLAAGIEGDFAPHAYYPRLRTLLGEPPTMGTYPSYGRMLELWSDLEQWLNHERGGKLGVLRTDIAGAWLHVGLPIAQAVLTEGERQHLHTVFAEAGLDAEYPPADLELARLVHAGGHALRARTRAALTNPESEYGAVLIDRVLEELESWNDAEDGGSNDKADRRAPRQGTAVLCLARVDEIARRVTMEVRCRFAEPFPASVTAIVAGHKFTCREAADGLSTAFVGVSGEKLDAASIDWARPGLLETESDSPVRWFSPQVRVFVNGRERGLPGFIEVQSLDPSRPFVIAANSRVVDAVRAWGSTSCPGFTELQVSGMPAGWSLFRADSANDDALISDLAPRLSFSKQLRRIKTVGGIHVPGARNSYFRFAPPSIRLDGGAHDTPVTIRGIRLTKEEDGSFQIPEELLTENILVVEAMDRSRVIYLQDSAIEPSWKSCCLMRDGEPQLSADSSDDLPYGPPATAIGEAILSDPRPLVPEDSRVHFIGRLPGEIANSAPSFEPVWIICQRGRREFSVEYVARELLQPLVGRNLGARAIREWKELLWHKRMQIRPPEFRALRHLFKTYQDAARDV